MNKAEFGILIEHPGNLGKSHIHALKAIAADFPYFQAGSVMLAKALFNENHYEFEKQLRATALVAPDREVLYRYINNIEYKQPKEVDTTTTENLNAEPIIAGEKPVAESMQEQTVDINMPTEKEEMNSAAISVDSTPEIIADAEPTRTKAIEPHLKETHSFNEWLMLSSGQNINTTPSDKNTAEEKPASKLEENVFEPVKTETDNKASEPSNVLKFESLLDKFISESPSISRPKAEFYNPANMAKQSVEQDEDLVTETLASVYYKQGHYKKAIRAYEKLCLIYPHKMAYFADLIQKIKKENKD